MGPKSCGPALRGPGKSDMCAHTVSGTFLAVRAGVQLVATAHGNELENVIKNPSLAGACHSLAPTRQKLPLGCLTSAQFACAAQIWLVAFRASLWVMKRLASE